MSFQTNQSGRSLFVSAAIAAASVIAVPVVAQTAGKPKPPAPAPALKTAPIAPPVSKVATEAPHRVEFLRDIAPILDRGGCSGAGCHGKFGGRGGFQISLMTLSPEDDYDPIVTGGRGRRIDFDHPERSLLLVKATGGLDHAGGPRFEVGSPYYNTILNWIKQGAPFDAKDPRLVSLQISPDKTVFKKTGDKQQIKVIATYTDGSKRDVTAQSVFMSSNSAVLSVDTKGLVSVQRWGGGSVMARYLGTITPSFFTLPQVRKGPYPDTPTNNIIDKLVVENLKRLNIVQSNLSTDNEFLRRVYLDTIGRLPTSEEMTAFVADKDAQKRSKVIKLLLDKPEFADLRALRLSDLLRVNPQKLGTGLGERAGQLYYEWIWNSVVANKPWDQFAREIITARGSTYQNGPANFYRIEREPNDRMENIGQAFLGVRMSCARCHKHPFDRWSTDDYWNFASFCGKVGIAGGRLYDENVITYNGGAEITNQSVNGRNKGKIAPATFLGEKTPAKVQPDMSEALAKWMTAPENPFFARAAVNRLWSYYFGKGIIHPVDDMRATTPENVPGLLNALSKELIDHKFDMKYMVGLILNSRTYQLSAQANETNVADDRYFSRFLPRPMPAQVLLDMINQASGAKEQFTSWPERSHAIQTAFPVGNYFLDAFGQSHREFLADIDPKLEPNLVQTLHMINSPYINDKVNNGQAVQEAVTGAKDNDDILNKLFMRAVGRMPTAAERAKAASTFAEVKDKKEAAQDALWALLTSREFYFNH
jgi:Protein of unknown function (DUF1549)/Protein of unknown function (DUF1553)